jgi:Protein of unknown function (DUF3761)
MKIMIRMMVIAAGLAASQSLMAQAPAGAPAGSTGQCKDGTYSTAASKSGACSGHQGVKAWYSAAPAKATAPAAAAPAAMPAPVAAKAAPAAAPAPTPAPAPVAAKAAPAAKAGPAATAASMPQAAGGGPGMVWVNTSSKVYHCPGTTYYGKTKEGKYMSESDAKAMGAHADHGNACTK